MSLSAAQWYSTGQHGAYVRAMKSSGGIVDLHKVERPAGDMSRPAISDIGLYQDFKGGSHVCDAEGSPSRLLARAAGCEILAELGSLGGAPLAPAATGLAPWAERRAIELMHARLSEDINLDELAAEARLSSFHFARTFKRSVGAPPRVYLTRLRIKKVCELLEHTDRPITQIAFEVGYASSQVLARIFAKHMRMCPSDYRQAVRDKAHCTTLEAQGPPHAGSGTKQ